MSSSRRLSDLMGIARGLQKVLNSFSETQSKNVHVYWQNSSLNQLPGKVGEKLEQTVSTAVVKQAQVQEKVDNLDKLIPKELKMPPVTEADLEELARDIEALGYMSGEKTTLLQPANLQPAQHTSEDKLETSRPSAHKSQISTSSTTPSPSSTASPTQNKLYATGDPAKQSLPSKTGRIDHKLSEKSRETKVPANRVSRIISFGSLAAGLGVGALAETARRGLGLSNTGQDDGTGALLGKSAFLSDANMERIVATLCRVRGAALKLGQMLSIQDNSMLNPQLQAAFERVRQSADFMPLSQMEKAMSSQLGPDWRSRFLEFDDKPFAAASIGQVHRAVLPDGQQVAVKVQYPGVAKSINSDINNLLSILKVWQILPKGMYAENLMDVSRGELAWECDYKREAKCMNIFRELLAGDSHIKVPRVYDEYSTDQVLVTELIPGIPLDKCTDLSQDTRDKLGDRLLRLCVTELYEWNIMQTDPNWSNFFYDQSQDQVYLLDFGATRQFSRRFLDVYIDIIKAAAVGDRDTILDKSKQLGFLTGYETKAMNDAHVEAVLVLGGPCGVDESFDFGQQDITKKIENIIPIMLKHRLGPPPEETYSLHRKLSGAFLLCAKLQSKVNVKRIYDPIFSSYKKDQSDKDYGLSEMS